MNDVIELYNVWLFVENGVYRTDWTEETLEMVRTEFKEEVAHFFSGLQKETWVNVFRKVDVEYTHCFWENTVLAHWIYLFVVSVVLVLAYVVFMRKYYWMHEEYLKNIGKKCFGNINE